MPKATHAHTLEKKWVFTVEESFKAPVLLPASRLVVLIVRTDQSTAHTGDARENHACSTGPITGVGTSIQANLLEH